VVLNAANEVAVASFLEGRLGFTSIPTVIERTLNAHEVKSVSTLELIRQVDAWARDYAGTLQLMG
jgi:1-deoxy-D-xylulose-5-phosphate reductoisomerase